MADVRKYSGQRGGSIAALTPDCGVTYTATMKLEAIHILPWPTRRRFGHAPIAIAAKEDCYQYQYRHLETRALACGVISWHPTRSPADHDYYVLYERDKADEGLSQPLQYYRQARAGLWGSRSQARGIVEPRLTTTGNYILVFSKRLHCNCGEACIWPPQNPRLCLNTTTTTVNAARAASNMPADGRAQHQQAVSNFSAEQTSSHSQPNQLDHGPSDAGRRPIGAFMMHKVLHHDDGRLRSPGRCVRL